MTKCPSSIRHWDSNLRPSERESPQHNHWTRAPALILICLYPLSFPLVFVLPHLLVHHDSSTYVSSFYSDPTNFCFSVDLNCTFCSKHFYLCFYLGFVRHFTNDSIKRQSHLDFNYTPSIHPSVHSFFRIFKTLFQVLAAYVAAANNKHSFS